MGSKLGLEFEILARDQVKARMHGLQKVSDVWLKTSKADEKGFSLEFFSKSYLCHHYAS